MYHLGLVGMVLILASQRLIYCVPYGKILQGFPWLKGFYQAENCIKSNTVLMNLNETEMS